MKKDIKFITLIYLGVALFIYVLTLRVENLEQHDGILNKNQSIVLRIK